MELITPTFLAGTWPFFGLHSIPTAGGSETFLVTTANGSKTWALKTAMAGRYGLWELSWAIRKMRDCGGRREDFLKPPCRQF